MTLIIPSYYTPWNDGATRKLVKWCAAVLGADYMHLIRPQGPTSTDGPSDVHLHQSYWRRLYSLAPVGTDLIAAGHSVALGTALLSRGNGPRLLLLAQAERPGDRFRESTS